MGSYVNTDKDRRVFSGLRAYKTGINELDVSSFHCRWRGNALAFPATAFLRLELLNHRKILRDCGEAGL